MTARRPRRRQNPEESGTYRDVVASIWAHRRKHNWEPGTVWSTAQTPGPCVCGAKVAHGQYVKPTGRRRRP